MKNIRLSILLTLLPLALAACGGGSTPAPTAAKTVTLKLATTGTPSENLAGVDITITLPNGVTPILNSDGTVAVTVITISGVAAPGTAFTRLYTPASDSTRGKLGLFVSSSIVAGFGAGEYATVVLSATPEIILLQSDFAFTGFRPIGVSGADVSGLTATLSEFTLL